MGKQNHLSVSLLSFTRRHIAVKAASLSILLLASITALAQSWVNVELQADQYSGETSWSIVQGDSTFASGGPYTEPFQYVQQLVELPPGEYNFVVDDAYGDGICCGFGEGWIGISNACGLNDYYYDFNTSQLVVFFDLLPCPPPTYGCGDPQAINYNPDAFFETDDCVYNITFQLDLNGPHPPEIDIPEVNSSVNGWCGSCWAMSDDDGNGVWEITVPMPQGQHLWKFSADEWEVQEQPVGVLESPCFLFDENGFVNRTINVEGPMTLPPFCWESCLPCGAIPGCTNPEASNWNPWANFNNGSCTGLTIQCDPWETEIVTTLVLDNYPGETSFSIHNLTSDEEIIDVSIGQLSDDIVGIPLLFSTCATTGDELEIVLNDSYGDGLGASQWGGQDGTASVTACGDTLWSLPVADFGYSVSSTFNTPLCTTIEDIVGCGDPDYLEYNPNATVAVDLLCETLISYGCMDDEFYNYNDQANAEDAIDSCFYTLTITDGVGDGWFGSWLGVYQDGALSPQYQMGPNDGNEEVFDIVLSAQQDIEIFFFTTPQSQNQIAQCGFMLEGPTGDTLINVPQWSMIPFPNTYSVRPYCGNSCIPFLYGCTDTLAPNFDVNANSENGTCYYNPGCTQAGYLEYYTQGYEADYDNGSCDIIAVFGCMDNTAFNYNEEANVETECTPVITGCMNELAFNYDPNANTPGDCTPYIYGCTDATAFNYSPQANADDGDCIDVVLGCMDESAINYNPLANTNSGCIESVSGCMDPDAFNFNNLANVPDNDLCNYDAGCITGPGEPYWANNQCYAWVISVDPYCCETGWDNVCVEMYEYCGNGITNVPMYLNDISVFPNPTQDAIRIQAPQGTITTVYNSVGQKITTTSEKRITLPAAGVYTVVINYKGRVIKETIVKQ